MFPRAVRVATIGGVDLRVDPSWLLILLVLVQPVLSPRGWKRKRVSRIGSSTMSLLYMVTNAEVDNVPKK